MPSPRIHQLNKQMAFAGKYVLYIMRSARVKNSPALSFSIQRANEQKVPVLAVYFFDQDFLNPPQRVFLLEGLIELKSDLHSAGIPLICLKVSCDTALKFAIDLSTSACELVMDAGYLRWQRSFDEKLNEALVNLKRRLTAVEGNVLVPVTLASDSSEYGARTIRPKLWHHSKAMLKENWSASLEIRCADMTKLIDIDLNEMDSQSELKDANKALTSEKTLEGGEKEASKVLAIFIKNRLNSYHKERNVPGSGKQSMLSAYLHFGMINPVSVVLACSEASIDKASKESFLDELIVRRELAFNFVYYARDTYDTLESLPDWARKTMAEHLNDKRDHMYTYEQLEKGLTSDKYWNAAQLEMVHTSKMHGYMRMYWGKKVIEWSENYQSALDFLITQNDKYEIDGFDPCSYAGVLWNFGLHDRAHAERNILGKIRYMCADGLKRKYKNNIDKYVEDMYCLAGREIVSIEPASKKVKEELRSHRDGEVV